MHLELKFASTPTADTPGTTLILQTDNKRYMFGHVSEGTQRIVTERKVGMRRFEEIFVSGQTDWARCGGLIGVLLTMIDGEGNVRSMKVELQKRVEAGELSKHSVPEVKKRIGLHGPENLMHLLSTARYFIFRTAVALDINEIENVWSDDLIDVYPLLIEPERGAVDGALGEVAGKKRRFEEFKERRKPKPERRKAKLREIINLMFNSTWNMETKVEEIAHMMKVNMEHSESESEDGRESPSKQSKCENDSGIIQAPRKWEPKDEQLDPKSRAPWPASVVKELPYWEPSSRVLSYIVKSRPVRGKFHPQKAIALGVKPGPDFRRLTMYETVTTEAGRVVEPHEVMEPDRPGNAFAFVEIPDARYIKPTLERPEWKDDKFAESLTMIIWVVSADVARDERLLEFMRTHKVQHIVSAPSGLLTPNHIAFKGQAGQLTRLNILSPSNFPEPCCEEHPAVPHNESLPYTLADWSDKWSIMPKFERKPDMVAKEKFTFSREEALKTALPEYLEIARKARERVEMDESLRELEDIPGKDVEILTLGTGSALPSKYRNVSASMVRFPDGNSLLFDAGENTIGQLKRAFNSEEYPAMMRGVRALYLSHLHADHHLGITSVIKEWVRVVHGSPTSPPSEDGPYLFIVAPAKYSLWLREMSFIEDFGIQHLRFVACEDLLGSERWEITPSAAANIELLYSALSLEKIDTRYAKHCPLAYTTAWTFKDGFKIAYSGDTMPNANFIDIGQDSTVLLHEATFDDELAAEAKAKRHSTTGEAIAEGKAMRAKYIVLTHFSQRYPKLPETGNMGDEGNILVAFDLMRIKVGEMRKFQHYMPALRELFKEEEEDIEVEVEEGDSVQKVEEKVEKKKEKKKKAKAKEQIAMSKND